MRQTILRFHKRTFDGAEGLEEAIIAENIVRVEQLPTHVRIEYATNKNNVSSIYVLDAYETVIEQWQNALSFR